MKNQNFKFKMTSNRIKFNQIQNQIKSNQIKSNEIQNQIKFETFYAKKIKLKRFNIKLNQIQI